MAADKLVDSAQLDDNLTSVAYAIRAKGGTSADLAFPAGFVSAIDAIPTGTPLPSLLDPASASDILDGKEAINEQGEVLTGTLVPPADTGANGLYKAIIENELYEDTIYDTGLSYIASFRLTCLGYRASAGATTSNIHFAEFQNVSDVGEFALGDGSHASLSAKIERLKFNSNVGVHHMSFGYCSSLLVLDFDSITFFPNAPRIAENSKNIEIFIVRSSTFCPLTFAGNMLFGNSDSNRPLNIKMFFLPDLLQTYQTATNWSVHASKMYPFYLASTVADIDVLLADSDIPDGALIICDAADYTQKYTIKEAI